MSFYDPDAEFPTTVSGMTGAFVNSYYNDYLDYWELQNAPEESDLTDQQRQYFRALERLGESFRECLHTLSVSSTAREVVREYLAAIGSDLSTQYDLDTITKTLAAQRPARDRLLIELGFEATDGLLATAEERIESLLAHMGHRPLSDRAAAFLDRATRLYLWGFDPECVVMCHAVLEAALGSLLDQDDMSKLGIAKRKHYRAVDLEKAALKRQIFDTIDGETAAELRQARNDTIHGAPNISVTAPDALSKLAGLLNKMYPREST